MPTDTSEHGFETRACTLLEESGWLQGDNQDYDHNECLDLAHLTAFLQGHPAGDGPGPQPGLGQQYPPPVP